MGRLGSGSESPSSAYPSYDLHGKWRGFCNKTPDGADEFAIDISHPLKRRRNVSPFLDELLTARVQSATLAPCPTVILGVHALSLVAASGVL